MSRCCPYAQLPIPQKCFFGWEEQIPHGFALAERLNCRKYKYVPGREREVSPDERSELLPALEVLSDRLQKRWKLLQGAERQRI